MLELNLAVDVGGTKMAAGLVDREGSLRGVRHVPTPSSVDPEVIWTSLDGLVSKVLGEASEGSVVVSGVGCGGPITPLHGPGRGRRIRESEQTGWERPSRPRGEYVSPLNIPAWREFPLRRRLEELTGLPTFLDNDAKALALGEGWVGAAVGCENYVAMVVSTGVGGGIVLDGSLLDGRLGNAGHIGHVVVVPDGRHCVCGGYGCLEAEASGTAISAITGRPPAEATAEVVVRTGTLVGRAVASVANLLDLSLVVVAGSVALGFGEPFFEAARRELALRARLAFSAGTRIIPAGLGGEGPLVGAGSLGWRGLDGEAGS